MPHNIIYTFPLLELFYHTPKSETWQGYSPYVHSVSRCSTCTDLGQVVSGLAEGVKRNSGDIARECKSGGSPWQCIPQRWCRLALSVRPPVCVHLGQWFSVSHVHMVSTRFARADNESAGWEKFVDCKPRKTVARLDRVLLNLERFWLRSVFTEMN